MLFHSRDRDLDFELGGKRYVVPAGSDVEIPDHLAYCVEARGLLLKPGGSGESAAVVTKAAAPKSAAPRLLPRVTPQQMAEDLADITGEDPADDAEDDADDGEDAAQRTADQLARQGIVLPGRRPGRPKK